MSTPMQRYLVIYHHHHAISKILRQANDTNPNNPKRHGTSIAIFPLMQPPSSQGYVAAPQQRSSIYFPLKQRMNVCLLKSLKPAHTSAGATPNTITAQLSSCLGLDNQFHHKERDSQTLQRKDKRWPVTHIRTFSSTHGG